MDQMNSYYNFNHKGIRWTHRVFTHFLGVSAVNACILYNNSKPPKKLSSIEYFDELIKALADLDRSHNWNDLEEEMSEDSDVGPQYFCAPVEAEGSAIDSLPSLKPIGKVYQRYRKKNLEGAVERLEGIHVPMFLKSNNRRRCVFHPDIKQRYFCETCQVSLCLSECAKESCWYKYHHEESWKNI